MTKRYIRYTELTQPEQNSMLAEYINRARRYVANPSNMGLTHYVVRRRGDDRLSVTYRKVGRELSPSKWEQLAEISG